ncbi:hypothetical protein IQ264_07135 [Phormidium sp. LEGE 05292]|uniref:hypothetical protein n=1 Tax=[Phormidium] sp. LEGE 05292 TaxID=767427 RepID=UPI001882D5CA|nr:hypothetical protein [Phormidium sp. LEGE 05292]MBE9225204.1 hypothetical protein [Phormidium sp. LEGE 05292]
MKRLLLGSLSFLFLSQGITSVAQAQIQATRSTIPNYTSNLLQELTPFELVTMAYQGYFQEQGIPSYALLVSAHQVGRLRAETLVEAAIRTQKLSPQVLKDQGYLNAVEVQLRELIVR